MRVCVSCQRRFGDEDLLEDTSKRMEADRVAIGLVGVCFQYYTCPRCSHDHVFLEVVPLPGETHRDLRGRVRALATAVQEVRVAETTILVVERGV
jgi:hypothetical protein